MLLEIEPVRVAVLRLLEGAESPDSDVQKPEGFRRRAAHELKRHVLQIIGSRQAIVVRLDGHALVENVALGGYNERPGGCRVGKLSASIRTHQLLVAM